MTKISAKTYGLILIFMDLFYDMAYSACTGYVLPHSPAEFIRECFGLLVCVIGFILVKKKPEIVYPGSSVRHDFGEPDGRDLDSSCEMPEEEPHNTGDELLARSLKAARSTERPSTLPHYSRGDRFKVKPGMAGLEYTEEVVCSMDTYPDGNLRLGITPREFSLKEMYPAPNGIPGGNWWKLKESFPIYRPHSTFVCEEDLDKYFILQDMPPLLNPLEDRPFGTD